MPLLPSAPGRGKQSPGDLQTLLPQKRQRETFVYRWKHEYVRLAVKSRELLLAQDAGQPDSPRLTLFVQPRHLPLAASIRPT